MLSIQMTLKFKILARKLALIFSFFSQWIKQSRLGQGSHQYYGVMKKEGSDDH